MNIKFLIISLLLLALTVSTKAASTNGYIVNIYKNGSPQCEMVYYGNERRVTLPYDSEYVVRLKNDSDKACACKIFIDGRCANSMGDIILYKGQVIDLERFIDTSLTEGKKFLFVKKTDNRVDDPTRKENGIVRVEFRKEKKNENIILTPIPDFQWQIPIPFTNQNWYFITNTFCDNNTILCSASFCSANVSVSSPGATVGGSDSSQTFSKVSMEFEKEVSGVIEMVLYGNEEMSKN